MQSRSRTFPKVLPAWLVVLDTTLGCRQGTLYKAPRNAERKLADDNFWAKSDYWNFLVNSPSAPLPVSYLLHKLIVIFCFCVGYVLPKRYFKLCSLFDKLRRVCNSWEWNLLHTWARPISDRFSSLSYNIFCLQLVIATVSPWTWKYLKSPYAEMTWNLIRTSRRQHSGLQHHKRWKTFWKQFWQECRHWKVRCLLCNISRCMMESLRRLGVSNVYVYIPIHLFWIQSIDVQEISRNPFLTLQGSPGPDEWAAWRLLHRRVLWDRESRCVPVCSNKCKRQIVGGPPHPRTVTVLKYFWKVLPFPFLFVLWLPNWDLCCRSGSREEAR